MPNTAEAILSVARGFGSAQMEDPDGEGRPFISGMVNGTRYGILIYGCEGTEGCDSVQFFASFGTPQNDLEFLNQWNLDKRFASAYREPDGDVVIHYSANVDFGVTLQNFEDTFDIWQLTLGQFTDRLASAGAESQ